jgi:hypothetical protein
MESFLQALGSVVLGCLKGFDRLRFRGSKRQLCYSQGAMAYFSRVSVLLKDYERCFAKGLTIRVCQAIEKRAKEMGLFQYLNNSQIRKEQAALEMAAKQGKTEGLIAVLACVEPSLNLRVRKNPVTKLLEPRLEPGKCQHYYHYYLDPVYGLRYTRLQSWFPFTMHAGLNGRDWLARQMTEAGIAFRQKDNCFPWIEDFAAAQRLMDKQLRTAWAPLLEGWRHQSLPEFDQLLGSVIPSYWSVQEAEYATDIAFHSAEELARRYPHWVQHAYASLGSRDLLRFMNYRVRPDGTPLALGEVKTTIKELLEGTCLRHRILRNLLKMYDKAGSVLRLETLLADLEHFKVFRAKEGEENGPLSYRRLRKGVADLHRRAQVSAKINERYAASLASVEDKQTLAEATQKLGQRVQWKGRPVRALNPLAELDAALLEAVNRGGFLVSGFCNRDIREILFPEAETANETEQKRLAAKVSRLLRILRGHGLIKKVHKANRYQVTEGGRTGLSALLAARQANTKQLLQAA